MNDLLKESDIVSLHINLTKESYHLISKGKLSLMKKDAILINTARGELVDEEAVAQALENRELAGYGADVIENEPLKWIIPFYLLNMQLLRLMWGHTMLNVIAKCVRALLMM